MKNWEFNWDAIGAWSFIGIFWVLVITLLVLAFVGCTTPKVIEQHHHHYQEADTMTIHAMIDSRYQSWHGQMDSAVHTMMQHMISEQQQQEQEHETTTETVTSYIDSLGREVRQEQRTTERNLSRQQQYREERLSREFEMRLQQAISHHDSIWQSRLDALQTHWEQHDSTSMQEKPVVQEDNRPWYKKLLSNIYVFLIAAGVLAVAFIIEKFRDK